MKKIISLFLILCFCNYCCLPALSADNNIKKPRAGTFNRAVKKGDIDKVDAYIKAGFNPNKKYWTTWVLYGTPIIGTAISSKQNQMLDFLLANGASPNPKSIFSPLDEAIGLKNSYATKRLLQAGADKNKLTYGYPVQSYGMKVAIDRKDNDLLDAFLNNGADPNAQFSVPLLYYSVVKNNPYAVEKLIRTGADQNKTFMNMTAKQLAFNKNYSEINEIFEKYDSNGNLINVKTADLEKAVDLLKDTAIGPIFYDYIKGNNITGKPIKIEYKDLSLFGEKYKDFLSICQIKDNQIHIYISSQLKNSSQEALATLISSVSIHQDKIDSINEEIYSAMLQAALWSDFTENKLSLKLEESGLVNTLNYYSDYWKDNNYDINAFKPLIKSNPAYKSLKQTSPGFSNEDIGLLKDKTLLKKTTENIASYCKDHDIATKLTTALEVVAVLSLVALEAIVIYNEVQGGTYSYIPTYTPAPQIHQPMVVPNWKYTYNAKTKHVDRYYNSVTIRSFY